MTFQLYLHIGRGGGVSTSGPEGSKPDSSKNGRSLLLYCYKNGKSLPSNVSLMVGREFYRDKYGMTSSNHVWFPDLGNHLGDEIWDLKGAGIFSIFPLGEKIRLNVLEDSM
ncbi:hypothetical protein AVEN_208052-1 [Araneus ventricosus]|uniref:Uncharacterized protein n=1 Tax=Araneus ventricosus TaxID=182803 RepID=A0A4Y2F444_ARAVE|nr:hypothetical protein AVEN_208052-1 [Araneus ventricosus]